MSDLFDCQKCGACCRGTPEATIGGTYVTVTHEDLALFTPIELPLIQMRSAPPWAGDISCTESGQCVFLTGEIGKQVACGIYDRRPTGCRQFEAGSPDCLKIREHHGIKTIYNSSDHGYRRYNGEVAVILRDVTAEHTEEPDFKYFLVRLESGVELVAEEDELRASLV